jgi:hypothetical protein
LVYFREVLDSNLDRNTDYPARGSSWFYSVPSGKFYDIIWIRPRRLSLKSVAILYSILIHVVSSDVTVDSILNLY